MNWCLELEETNSTTLCGTRREASVPGRKREREKEGRDPVLHGGGVTGEHPQLVEQACPKGHTESAVIQNLPSITLPNLRKIDIGH